MIKLELTSTDAMNLAIALSMSKHDLDDAQLRAEFEALLKRIQELRAKEQDEFIQSIKQESQDEN